MYEEIEQKKIDDEAKKPKNPFELAEEDRNKPRGPPALYNKDGEIRQCNQGDYKFRIWEEEEDDLIFLELKVPKYLATAVIDADVNPTYVRIDVKGKIT
jgi:protein TilB